MANNALFTATDRAPDDAAIWEQRDDDMLWSRWCMPISWFFFFRPDDVISVDVTFDTSTWQETRFFADRCHAIALFRSRLPLLLDVVGRAHNAGARLEQLAARIERLPRRYLAVNPSEIFEDYERYHSNCRQALERIEDSQSSPNQVWLSLRFLGFAWDDEDAFIQQVIGNWCADT